MSTTSRAVESFGDEHEAFAASRVSQYVFVPTKDTYFGILDQHADTLEGDVKPPLVLVGNEGSGKSALLANWVHKRREHKHRDEFLFQHFVGCTAQSLQLAHTLFRLETALKDFFQLREMKVPDNEVELRWSLNRFLEAASKKHSPARIVIIIDGIHSLKSEGAPDGFLYWLPTELPPCVRFIVSTVEIDRNIKGKKQENTPHHTFVELTRRQCQIERIIPLGVTTCHAVINSFRALHQQSFELSEAQQFKIVTANSSTQPMYLRTILQAIRLATFLTHTSPDDLLEKFLSCVTAHELIHQCLNICCSMGGGGGGGQGGSGPGGAAGGVSSVSAGASNGLGDEEDEHTLAELLGKMLSMVYASRSGLTEVEIWGLLRMVSRVEPTPEQQERLLIILKDYTMVVNDMYSFSHEVYREVVYHKYIFSRGTLVRWHNYLARFFDQLPPCDRKLVALPYHLEMAGSWSKVKNCLTDIEMFQLWWTPKFKPDFIKFWSSLTRKQMKEIPSIASINGGAGQTGNDSIDGNGADPNGGGGMNRNGIDTGNGEFTTYSNGANNNNGNNGNNGALVNLANTGQGGNNAGNGTAAQEAAVVSLMNRPSYDIVEEYCKSLDEYRLAKYPSDAFMKEIILNIADFLLEFAMLGHEREADVPALIHPKIPPEDLKALGVPYIITDDKGMDTLMLPKKRYEEAALPSASSSAAGNHGGAGGSYDYDPMGNNEGGAQTAGKIMEDAEVTIYFYNRWMWIQFPCVALGNADPKYFEHLNSHGGGAGGGGGRSLLLLEGSGDEKDGGGGADTKGGKGAGSGGTGGGGSGNEGAPGSASANRMKLSRSMSSNDEVARMLSRVNRGNVAASLLGRGGNGKTAGQAGIGSNQKLAATDDLALLSRSANDLKLPSITNPGNNNNGSMTAGSGMSGTGNAGLDRELDRERRLKELRKRGHRSLRTIPRIPPPPPAKAKHPRTPPEVSANAEEKTMTQVMLRTLALQDSIQIAREEYDQLVQDKVLVERKLQSLKDGLVDLQRTAESVTIYDDALAAAVTREMDAQEKLYKSKIWNINLLNLAMMCDRHPANVPALILELQEKIELDNFLLQEIKKRLWEQRFEQQAFFTTFRHMKNLVQEAISMHNLMLDYRYKMKKELSKQAEDDERAMNEMMNTAPAAATSTGSRGHTRAKQQAAITAGSSSAAHGGSSNALVVADQSKAAHKKSSPSHTINTHHASPAGSSHHGGHGHGNRGNKAAMDRDSLAASSLVVQTWDEIWMMISSATGITEPEAFFQRMNNAEILEQQIFAIKRTSETRLEMLKAEAVMIEKELQEVENNAKALGIQSTKEHQKQLTSKQSELKQKKEDAEAKEALAQKAMSGLAQISDILCIPKSDEDADVKNVVHEIETILDTLISEREKQAQQQQSGSTRGEGSSVLQEAHATRSPELDLVVSRHESPTVRLPKKLPSRPESEDGGVPKDATNKALQERLRNPEIQDQLHWNTSNRTFPPGVVVGMAAAAAAAEEEDELEGENNDKTWDRNYVKTASNQLVRVKQLRAIARAAEKEKEEKKKAVKSNKSDY